MSSMSSMSSIFHCARERSNSLGRYSHRFLSVSMELPSYEVPVESHRRCPARHLSSLWELLFAVISSIITTSYTLQHESRVVEYAESELQNQAFNPGHFGFVLDPSPLLMLGACLVLGCSISSFAYQRQEHDKFQTPIFVLAISLASILGIGLGTNANLITLGLVPWALCLAMVLSACVHWILRRCSRRSSISCEADEKHILLVH